MIKLLLVDDEKTTRDGLLEYIPWKELGIDAVKAAEDGIKALELAMEFNPHIILTDVRMPKMNGIELAEQIKVQLPQCKVIFLSGYTDKEYLKSAIRLQAMNYIEKPVNIDEVKEVITKTVSLCRMEEEKKQNEIGLANKINESLPILKEKLCLELTVPNFNSASIQEKFDFLGIPIREQCFCTSVIINLDIDASESISIPQDQRDSLIKVTEQIFENEKVHCLCAVKEPGLLVIHILGDTVKSRAFLENLLGKVKSEIEQISGIGQKLFIAAGSVVNSVHGIHTAYQRAAITLQKQFFLGHGNIVFFEEDNSPVFDFGKHNIQDFLDLLIAEKKNEAEIYIKKIVSELKLCTNTLVDNIKNYFFNMLTGLSKIADDRNIVIVESEHKKEYFWDIISKAKSIYEIEAYLLEKLNIFFGALAEKEQSNSIVYSVIKYVRNNYKDPNLSIKTIASYAFVTPNYLSLVFKKGTGKTINQFITETRIEKAKELLKDRRIKLYEIASLVGFSDANYFAKIFKKVEGMNPSDYREKHIL